MMGGEPDMGIVLIQLLRIDQESEGLTPIG